MLSLCYANSQEKTGNHIPLTGLIKLDTLSISNINRSFIDSINSKLIRGKYYKLISEEREMIIESQKRVINEKDKVIILLKEENEINKRLVKEGKRRLNYVIVGSSISIGILLTLVIIK